MAISRRLRRILCSSSLLHRVNALTYGQQRWNHTPRTVAGIAQVEDTELSPSEKGLLNTSAWKIVDSRSFRIRSELIIRSAWMVLNTLWSKGYVAYLVGGCVRDLILQRAPKDFDVITTANLKQIKKHFRRCIIVGRRFPICQVYGFDRVVEVSSFNTVAKCGVEKTIVLPKLSNNYSDTDYMCWKNCMRRDFTINCLFFDPFKCKIYDYVGALIDLKASKVRTVIPAHLSFQEDNARILRGIRIAARLGFQFSKETETAIKDFSSSIQTLPKNRLIMEMNYMMAHGASASSIILLEKLKLLETLLPFHAAYMTSQSNNVSAQKSVMLMKLLVNADKLLRADRPCSCNLWLGLLAFHMALVDKPQDSLVVWAFSSILYHGTWHEAAAFVKGSSEGLLCFDPEIKQSAGAKPEDVLFSEISQFVSLAKSAVEILTDTNALQQSLAKYSPLVSSQCLVFVSPKTGKKVRQLFDVLNDCKDVDCKKAERRGINYELLKEGDLDETRFVLGKIIMDTMKGKHLSDPAVRITREDGRIQLSRLNW